MTGPLPRVADTQHDGIDNKQYIRLSKNRNESYGMRLGYKLFVDSLNEYGVAASLGLRKGDEILTVSNYILTDLEDDHEFWTENTFSHNQTKLRMFETTQ